MQIGDTIPSSSKEMDFGQKGWKISSALNANKYDTPKGIPAAEGMPAVQRSLELKNFE